MREFLSQGLFLVIIQTTICLCVFLLFLAIFIDFALYSRKDQVQREKKSIIETGTMTLFLLVFYGILQSRVGVIPIQFGLTKELLMILGTVMIVVGCIVNINGRLNLGRNWANQIKIYQEHTLVQTGMYKVVRHPLYASIIFMFYGACLVYQNIVSFIAVSIVFVPFMVYRARQEENLLMQRFPRYHEYKQNTGMLFPKILREEKGFNMNECKPVNIPNSSFNFCKYTISLLLWCSLILQSKMLVFVCFAILFLSALLKVKNAPLVFLYTHTLNRIFTSKWIIIDENAVWFAHTVGAVFSGVAIVFLYYINPLTGWVITGILAVLKTSGALGFCGAMKLYGCLNNQNGKCCRVGKKIKKHQCG